MDLVKYFSKYDGRISGENEITMPCPKCKKEEKHFNINIVKMVCGCFRCGYKNTVIGLMAHLEHTTIEEIKSRNIVPTNIKVKKTNPYIPMIDLPDKSQWTRRAKKYLEMRKLDAKTIKDFDLYYCSEGWFGGRIIIPVTFGKKPVTFQARSVGNHERRYLFPKGSASSRILYNYDNIQHGEDLVIVEGPFDVMRLHQQNIPVVATFGKKISKEQIELLQQKEPKTVTIMYDADAGKAIQATFAKLNKIFTTKIALLDKGDPADCDNPNYYIERSIYNTNDIFFLQLEMELHDGRLV